MFSPLHTHAHILEKTHGRRETYSQMHWKDRAANAHILGNVSEVSYTRHSAAQFSSFVIVRVSAYQAVLAVSCSVLLSVSFSIRARMNNLLPCSWSCLLVMTGFWKIWGSCTGVKAAMLPNALFALPHSHFCLFSYSHLFLSLVPFFSCSCMKNMCVLTITHSGWVIFD